VSDEINHFNDVIQIPLISTLVYCVNNLKP
jgi:hypothetical protein